jgi:hypothetical protein
MSILSEFCERLEVLPNTLSSSYPAANDCNDGPNFCKTAKSVRKVVLLHSDLLKRSVRLS